MRAQPTYDEFLEFAKQHMPGIEEGDPRIITRAQFEAHLTWLKDHPVGSFDDPLARCQQGD